MSPPNLSPHCMLIVGHMLYLNLMLPWGLLGVGLKLGEMHELCDKAPVIKRDAESMSSRRMLRWILYVVPPIVIPLVPLQLGFFGVTLPSWLGLQYSQLPLVPTYCPGNTAEAMDRPSVICYRESVGDLWSSIGKPGSEEHRWAPILTIITLQLLSILVSAGLGMLTVWYENE